MDDGLVVVDSDLVVDFLRGRDPGAGYVERLLRANRLRLTAVTAFELRVGTDFSGRRKRIETLLARRTLSLDRPVALHAGAVFAGLEAEGRTIGIKDCLQAGICLRFDLPLATRNARHFERVKGLRLEAVGEG